MLGPGGGPCPASPARVARRSAGTCARSRYAARTMDERAGEIRFGSADGADSDQRERFRASIFASSRAGFLRRVRRHCHTAADNGTMTARMIIEKLGICIGRLTASLSGKV